MKMPNSVFLKVAKEKHTIKIPDTEISINLKPVEFEALKIGYKARANSKPAGPLKSTLISGAVGAGIGSFLSSMITRKPVGIGTGFAVGGLIGALGGKRYARSDKQDIALAKKIVQENNW